MSAGSLLEDQLATAVALHEAGDLAPAESIYRRILNDEPLHHGAWHLLGVISLQRGQFREATAAIARAIAIDPRCALYHRNAGAALRAQGQIEPAIAAFHNAIELDPTLVGARYNLALALEAAGLLESAGAELRIASELFPESAEIWQARGRIAAAQNQSTEAIDCGRRACTLAPNYVAAHYNLGNALFRRGDFLDAVAAYQSALDCRPAAKAAQLARICNNLGDSLKALGRFDEAGAALRRALSHDPELKDAHNNLGAVLQFQGDLPSAEAAYRRALACDPDFDCARTNLGNVLTELGRYSKAIDCYDEVLRLRPEAPETRFNRALLLLKTGDFTRGWPEYEWRFARKVIRRTFLEPRWDGSPLGGRTLLVYAEQGIGDEIQFARFLCDPLLKTGQVVVECELRLVPLFARSFPWATVLARPVPVDEDGHIDAFRGARHTGHVDMQIPMGSLPGILRNDMTLTSPGDGYLRVDGDRSQAWRDRLARERPALLVGFSWQGGAEPDIQRKRSTTASDWEPVLTVPGVTFVDLQYGDSPERDALIASGAKIRRFLEVDALRDLDEFAALIAACDLVLSVDNSTAHLAGALGVPVWTLLPFAADWRWGDQGDDTHWYPSMRLYRQPAAGSWAPVFDRAATDLAAYGPG